MPGEDRRCSDAVDAAAAAGAENIILVAQL
jgi:hypothetical protein